jgi:hypothetical protein
MYCIMQRFCRLGGLGLGLVAGLGMCLEMDLDAGLQFAGAGRTSSSLSPLTLSNTTRRNFPKGLVAKIAFSHTGDLPIWNM